MSDDLTPAQVDAQGRIHDLMSELADLIGPSFDGEHDLDFDEAPQGQVFLAEWVTVAYWIDETGAGFSTRTTSAGLPAHHRDGLLHDGLWGF